MFGLHLLDNRYPALHGLRVLGLVGVVQFHVTMFLASEGVRLSPWATQTSYRLFFGMDLFFVLSGFLIGSILLRARSSGQGTDLRRFYLRRVLRTFPPYYLVLALLAVRATPLQRSNWPWEAAFLTNVIPPDGTKMLMGWGWSLAFEEQFYLLAPWLIAGLAAVASSRTRIGILIAGIVLAAIVRFAIWRAHPGASDDDVRQAIYFSPYTRFDTLLTGILVAVLHQEHAAWLSAKLASPRVRGYLLVAILACLWLLMDPMLFGRAGFQPLRLLEWGTVTSVMYACMLVLLLHGPPSLFTRALARPELRWFATLGYGIYLVHVPICELAAKHVTPLAQAPATKWALVLALVLGGSALAAYVLHLLVEKPALRLRTRIESW